MVQIKFGSNISTFTLSDQIRNIFDINSVISKKNLVIYFYLKDDSQGSTAQAWLFSDQFEVFKKADAVIFRNL